MIFGAVIAEAGVSAVWALHESQNIERDGTNSPYKTSNYIWDGTTASIFGAKNEIVGFQVMVQADGSGISSLSASLPQLTHSGGGASIVYAPPVADPSNYVGRPIHLFSVNYMNITQPTTASWVLHSNGNSDPDDQTGWKPVQLVPENATQGRGGFPLEVSSNQNQSIWIDIYIGKSLPAGMYTGNVTIDADGSQQLLPVQLEVFDFTLPDENSMPMWGYWEPEQMPTRMGGDYEDEFHRMAHRYRVELSVAYDEGTAEARGDLFDGSAFTSANGYEGPGENTGMRVLPRSLYGIDASWEVASTAYSQGNSWMDWVNANAAEDVITFLYVIDEPNNQEAYDYAVETCTMLRGNTGSGADLPLLVAEHANDQMDGLVDIWSSGPWRYEIAAAIDEIAKGNQWWTYNGGRPYHGAVCDDAPAIEARMIPWASFKHDVDVYWFWMMNHWYHNRHWDGAGNREQNIWGNPITFNGGGSDLINGDGVFFYPGLEIIYPAEDRGIPGPIPCIRLANMRRAGEQRAPGVRNTPGPGALPGGQVAGKR
ncbi:hypothetical protein ACFL5V_04360 [Fibrobacterota bacterium]